MKQTLFVLIAAILISACNNTSGWSTADKNEFNSSCVQSATQTMGAEGAKSYCSCMQQKLEKKLSVQQANKLTAADMQTPEMQAMIKDCLNGGGNTNNNNNRIDNPVGNPYGNNNNNGGGEWSDADKQKFMNTCLTNARNAGADDQTSNTHCNCTLEKIMKKYRNYDEANRLATKQEIDAMEQECNTNNNQ